MKKFIFVYEGGSSPKSEEEEKMIMDKWTEWFTDLGEKVVDAGFPFMTEAKMHDGKMSGVSSTGMTGYSVIKAESMDEALEMAKSCPHLNGETKVHVFEEMPLM